MSVKSRIYVTESVSNTVPRGPKADANYIVTYVVFPDGTMKPALFTDNDIKRALFRADKNPEDVLAPYEEPDAVEPDTETKSWWDKLRGL